MSKLGYCSRSQAFALVRAGKVRVNGSVARNPSAGVRMGVDRIEVEGVRVAAAEKMYVVLNKPRGIVTTAADEKGRDTVYALLPAGLPWLGPVGRLDKASEGLLLMTNDSEWAARVTDPATHLDKRYHVQIGVVADERLVRRLEEGVVADGELLRVKRARVLRGGGKNSWVELVLDEGKNRQIRRIFEACEIEVLRLIRVAIGPLELGELAKGAHRRLTVAEKTEIDRAMN